MAGIEPATSSLPRKRSTPELHWQKREDAINQRIYLFQDFIRIVWFCGDLLQSTFMQLLDKQYFETRPQYCRGALWRFPARLALTLRCFTFCGALQNSCSKF